MLRFLLLPCLLIPSLWGFEGLSALHAPLTVVVDSEKPIPSPALQELQNELDQLLKQGQRRVEWKMRGEMQPGTEAADLVVIDRDLFAIPGAQLKDARVMLTMVGGRIVFERK